MISYYTSSHSTQDSISMVPKHFPTVVFAARNLERAVTCLGLRANEQQYRLRRKSDTIVSPEQPYTTSEVQSLWPW